LRGSELQVEALRASAPHNAAQLAGTTRAMQTSLAALRFAGRAMIDFETGVSSPPRKLDFAAIHLTTRQRQAGCV
jgi:hypothetical protein